MCETIVEFLLAGSGQAGYIPFSGVGWGERKKYMKGEKERRTLLLLLSFYFFFFFLDHFATEGEGGIFCECGRGRGKREIK